MSAAVSRPDAEIRFVKMHGAGNDFVIVDASALGDGPDPARVRKLADRRIGVGCDQLIVIDRNGQKPGYRIFNSDGQPAGQCGNGARCVARLLFDRGQIDSTGLLGSPAGNVAVEVDQQSARVSMGAPDFRPAKVPFLSDDPRPVFTFDGRDYPLTAVSMGNPHAVFVVNDCERFPLADFGPAVQADARFPDGVNVGIAEICAPQRIRLRVFERGVGETLACGSGACAAAAVIHHRSTPAAGAPTTYTMQMPGGELPVEVSDRGIWLGGPTAYVFEGKTL